MFVILDAPDMRDADSVRRQPQNIRLAALCSPPVPPFPPSRRHPHGDVITCRAYPAPLARARQVSL